MIKPILKWVGGKRQLIPEIEKRIPSSYNTYLEPFLGGGAVLFHIQPEKAIVSDINVELINMYNVIKNNNEELIESLKNHKNTSEYFYDIRSKDRTDDYDTLSDIEKASRIIYINKTCYNGLYRVNSKGQINTPYGSYKNPLICDEDTINDLSNFFNKNDITILNQSFEKTLDLAQSGDFVYLDPPYDPVSDTSSFVSYSANGFTRDNQKQLKLCCDELSKKNIKFLLSNSATDYIKDLYKDYNIDIIKAKRNINSDANKRGDINEVLISNY